MSRSLLCLFDRDFDLGVGLAHPWTYKPMVSRVGGMSQNDTKHSTLLMMLSPLLPRYTTSLA